MSRLISRAELARLAGLSRMAITKVARTQLAGACVGPRIDLDHPSVLAYLAQKGVTPPPPLAEPREPLPDPTPPSPSEAVPCPPAPALAPPLRLVPPPSSRPPPPSDQDLDIEQFSDMTLREIAERFGTATAFKDWLDARRKQVAIREKELKNWENERRLIPRDAVRAHVFAAIDGANRRLLQDAACTIARRLYAMAKSGTAVEEAEQVVRDIIGSQLRPVKDTAARALREQ